MLTTDGSTTFVVYDLDLPKFTTILPHAASLTLYTLTQGAPAGNEFEWNVQFRSGFDRDHELATVVALATPNISTNGPIRHGPVNVSNSFQLASQLQVVARNGVGFSGVRTAVVSAVLAVELVA